jgi:hypothetical protein
MPIHDFKTQLFAATIFFFIAPMTVLYCFMGNLTHDVSTEGTHERELVASAICGTLASERGFTNFYLEEDGNNLLCYGEYRHPFTQSLMKMKLDLNNKGEVATAMDSFVNGRK